MSSNRQAWMTDDQWYCAQVFAELVGGFHHVNGKIHEEGSGIRVSDHVGMYYSTFDFDRLTRLVFLAHDRCVRFALGASGPRRVAFLLHRRRSRDGGMSKRHPTIESALDSWRQRYPPDSDVIQAELDENS